jgi:hypothetical protein
LNADQAPGVFLHFGLKLADWFVSFSLALESPGPRTGQPAVAE